MILCCGMIGRDCCPTNGGLRSNQICLMNYPFFVNSGIPWNPMSQGFGWLDWMTPDSAPSYLAKSHQPSSLKTFRSMRKMSLKTPHC